MAKSFGERLKEYRQAKNLTQQALGEKLGVSNKTVSRWESDGGFPDVPLLVPLAHALGVSTDDLLDEQKPIRTLTTADWQSLLSFAFALGGGVLFFLLDLFMPGLLCYLAYLGCMAYGVYLQKYYSYRSSWFFLSNGVMNLSVNVVIFLRGVAALMVLPLTMTINNANDWNIRALFWLKGHILWVGAACLLLAFLATAVTQLLIYRWNREEGKLGDWLKPGELVLEFCPMTAAKVVPLLIPMAGVMYWMSFSLPDLPIWYYRWQSPLFCGLMALGLALCVLLFWKKGRRGMLVPSLGLTLACCFLPMLTDKNKVVAIRNGYIYDYVLDMNRELYVSFSRVKAELLIFCGVVALLYLACCFVRIRRKEPGNDLALEEHTTL